MGLCSIRHDARLAERASALACRSDGHRRACLCCHCRVAIRLVDKDDPRHNSTLRDSAGSWLPRCGEAAGKSRRCARVVAVVSAVWIGAALIIDAVLGFFHLSPFKLYSASDVFADMRFYLGWTLGLLLAPYAGERRPAARPGHDASPGVANVPMIATSPSPPCKGLPIHPASPRLPFRPRRWPGKYGSPVSSDAQETRRNR
jgi:hypothetical protein